MAATLYALGHREKYPEQYLENKNTEADVQKEVSTEAEINTVSSQEVQTKIIDGNKELHTEKESAYESEYDSVDNSANISTDDLAYKSAYETVYESINPSEEKTEKVDWNNVDLKNYVYFQKDRIWKDMNFPQRIVQTAKKIIRDKKIKLEQVNVGYIEFEENVIGEVIGTGDDGKLSFPIQIRFNRDEVLNTMTADNCSTACCKRREKNEACIGSNTDSAMEGGHRILVFSQFTSMLAILGEKLKSICQMKLLPVKRIPLVV